MSGEVAARKVAAVRERVARVRELLQAVPRAEEMLTRRTEAEALLFNLYLAIQACTDLAMHLVADRGLAIPGDARGAFESLARAHLLPADLASRLAGAVSLRNRIAHAYGTLDLALVHRAAQEDLEDLEAFAAAAAAAYGF